MRLPPNAAANSYASASSLGRERGAGRHQAHPERHGERRSEDYRHIAVERRPPGEFSDSRPAAEHLDRYRNGKRGHCGQSAATPAISGSIAGRMCRSKNLAGG